MGYWNRGLRGSGLEDIINLTNDVYKKKKIAVIQKIPTPITPVRFDKQTKYITLAYFEQKSTVDYIGVAQGVPICFDVKETTKKSFPLQNIHNHQIDFMKSFVEQQGVAFVLVHFVVYSEYYCLPFNTLLFFWEKAQTGGRKSIPYSEFDKDLIVPQQDIYINYLEIVSKKML